MKKLSDSTLVLLLGIVLFLIGCIRPFMYEEARESGYEVEATIVEVIARDESDSESGNVSTSYTIYGDYEVDGKVYKHVKIGKYYDTDKYHVGGKITAVVNPNNPGKVMGEGGVLCVVAFLIMIGAIVYKIRAKKKRKKGQTQA